MWESKNNILNVIKGVFGDISGNPPIVTSIDASEKKNKNDKV
ncbi:2361_t:CDS:1 [Ambispora leptoticha]|uniref:2361_t:CDS:1 n=1 Tax=Ambispora leptoticha TaxID=144679 RepID=A0A9N9NJG5_9GLOM|nr:2361_t:CDS:1 [Ambispora leptoticha]